MKNTILILSAIFLTGIVSGWLIRSSEYRVNSTVLKYQDSIYTEISNIRIERDGLNKQIDSLTILFNTGNSKLSNQITQLKYEKPPQVNYNIVSDSALLKRLLAK
jgi:hypothetical protein